MSTRTSPCVSPTGRENYYLRCERRASGVRAARERRMSMGKLLSYLSTNLSSKTGLIASNSNGIASKKAELGSEFLPSNFKALRRDRTRRGWGVLIAVKEQFAANELPLHDVDGEIV